MSSYDSIPVSTIAAPPLDELDAPVLSGLVCAAGPLPLVAVTVRAHLVGATASVALTQIFDNPYDEPIEVSYVFPLPDRAAVHACALHRAGRVVEAKLLERGQARDDMARAAEDGKQAALAEQERTGVFTITLGNLAPKERATVELRLAHPLPRDDGRYTLRIPLVLGDRYVPGAVCGGPQAGAGTTLDTDRVPDASRLSPPRLAPGAAPPALDLSVRLEHGAFALAELECTLPATRSSPQPGVAVVGVDPDARWPLDRDFVLRFRLDDDELRTQLRLLDDPEGGEGTFQLTVLPPASPLLRRPRDVVMLLDRSGSMDGWKIVAARRALARMIECLDSDDRVAAYAFGSGTWCVPGLAPDRLHPARAALRARMCAHLEGLDADGGTELAPAMELAVSLLSPPAGPERGQARGPERDRWLVLVTDGLVANDDELVRIWARAEGVKLLAVGIDEAVGSPLFGKLARGAGHVELVQNDAELDDAMARAHVRLATPALERVTLATDEPGSLHILSDTVVPPGPHLAFPGQPLVLRGRYRGPLGAVTVTGDTHGGRFEQRVLAERTDAPALRVAWARDQLDALEDRYACVPHGRHELWSEIVRTSLRFGVLCRFTALLAVDEHGPRSERAERHVQQPVAAPHRAVREAAIRAAPVLPARGDGGRRSERTQSGVLRGKFVYLSPEQAYGCELTPRHQIFVLANLLWELLCAERLFVGVSDFDTLQAILDVRLPEPLLPRQLRALEAPVRRAFAKVPEDRHASVAAFADDLERAQGDVASRAEVAAWLTTVPAERNAELEQALARAAHLHVPAGGYVALARTGFGRTSVRFLAVRAGVAGNEAISLARLDPALVRDSDAVEDLLCEANLSIEGLVPVLDAGTDMSGGVFIAQPFVAGRSLRELVSKRGPVPPAVAVAVIAAVARALDRAARLRSASGAPVTYLHRWLSPESVRIEEDGRPVVVSLGLAPSAEFTAVRRRLVPIDYPPGTNLGEDEGTFSPPPRRCSWVPVATALQPERARAGLWAWIQRRGAFWK